MRQGRAFLYLAFGLITLPLVSKLDQIRYLFRGDIVSTSIVSASHGIIVALWCLWSVRHRLTRKSFVDILPFAIPLGWVLLTASVWQPLFTFNFFIPKVTIVVFGSVVFGIALFRLASSHAPHPLRPVDADSPLTFPWENSFLHGFLIILVSALVAVFYVLVGVEGPFLIIWCFMFMTSDNSQQILLLTGISSLFFSVFVFVSTSGNQIGAPIIIDSVVVSVVAFISFYIIGRFIVPRVGEETREWMLLCLLGLTLLPLMETPILLLVASIIVIVVVVWQYYRGPVMRNQDERDVSVPAP
jgi:hypothetical protein